MNASTEKWNLTGVWHGSYTYTYTHLSDPVSFVATLIETASHFSGTTHEPHSFFPETLYATVSGHRNGRAVAFTKTCQQGGIYYVSPIEYDGLLNEDGTEIEGRWTISREWSGKFLMIRSRGQTAEVLEKKSEKA